MTQLIIDFNSNQNSKLEKFKKKWKLTGKGNVVKRMVDEFKEIEKEKNDTN